MTVFPKHFTHKLMLMNCLLRSNRRIYKKIVSKQYRYRGEKLSCNGCHDGEKEEKEGKTLCYKTGYFGLLFVSGGLYFLVKSLPALHQYCSRIRYFSYLPDFQSGGAENYCILTKFTYKSKNKARAYPDNDSPALTFFV